MPKLTKQQPQIHPYRYVLGNMARIELTEDGIVVSGVIETDPYCDKEWWYIQPPSPLVIIQIT